MDFGGGGGTRVIGDYILGPKIGSGSFAVVWRSRHRKSGTVVAVKEIDKKQLSPKVSENLFKEITILSTIDHPNIIRLFEAIQTKDRIYLVLEYCSGGDLAAYIHRHGKVSEATARHFMIQLAAGLQVLQEKNLIHRDLKPQNLLLATSGATPLMKIGDFGFARSLTPQGLADTLCGSPLYMAPEIIQNQKYDAKADLWSVGAILFQLVTGKPPFDGNSQLQLFQNILTSTEPQFPQEALKELHSDCLDLCKGLLRRNPVERLTFKEFFNHNFLQEPRLIMHVEQSLLHPSERSVVQHLVTSTSDMSQLHSGHHVESLVDDPVVVNSVLNDTLALQRNTGKKTIGIQAVETPVFGCSHLSKEPQVSRLMESIEKDYVLVNHHFASLEAFSEYFEASVQDNSTCKVSICSSKRTNTETGVPMQTNDPSHCHAGELENPKSGEPVALAASRAFDVLSKMHGTSSLSSSNRLELLHLYVQILAELSCEKYNAKLYLESFAVELVVLAIWKKALEVCESWMNMGVLPASTLANEARTSYGDVGSSQNMEKKINFRDPLSVYMWAKEGFIAAVDSAQTLSRHIQNMDGEAEMPDAMEIIFQEALLVGKSGAVDEYMENRGRAAASYSKAMLLLSFIVGEATNLPLNPPFLLTAANEKRILQYIHNLQFHQKSSSDSSPKATHILLSE
ncbi:hypothetical protein HN51_014394 [Arachis hypogaea]|uniref:Protein kinase domain-containing protein n=1 Tax=Arachis hypogaea TaxID=3818 RepID=A0A445CPL3_ARAHY|nr:serine/threonine-protein kinase ATG1a [Arachis hypogaea]RYR52872.1 hypothetical protein Ahy_A06g027739 [Arachis hypogaea]